MAFTEFYCQTTGSNLNAGSTTSDGAVYTGVGDSDGTSIFTPSDGSTPASSVNVGDWVSVYVTAGATVATFIGRVTAVGAGVNGAITVSTTAKSGTFPAASAGAHTITLKTGGAWKGPNSAAGFPFNFITAVQTDAVGNTPRVNFKGGTNYAITAAITHTVAGPLRIQGYTSTPGDGGKATIDGGTSGTSYILLSPTGNPGLSIYDMILQNNGATGSANGLVISGSTNQTEMVRVIVNSIRGNGFSISASGAIQECEAYACNQSNTTNMCGFDLNGAGSVRRCYSHDNVGSNAGGFNFSSTLVMDDCTADSNGNYGVQLRNQNNTSSILNCDFYNNGGSGVIGPVGGNSQNWIIEIENCNFVKNGAYGIDLSSITGKRLGSIINCGFGSGSQVNPSGQTNGLGTIEVVGSITYASGITPWNAPTTGDFSITLAAAKGSGRGNYTQTGNSKTGTLGHPDIGAAQHQDTGGTIIMF